MPEVNDSIVQELSRHLFRQQAGKMVAVLCHRFGYAKADTAMDIVQDSFEAALRYWKCQGVPQNPSAWLMRTAINKMITYIKKQQTDSAREAEAAITPEHETPEETQKEGQLNLLFFFASLPIEPRNKTALTLYYLCGFKCPEIANALYLTDEAVKKILSRNKQALQQFKPDADYLQQTNPKQNAAILETLYLMFNEGYKTTRQTNGIAQSLCFDAMYLLNLILECRPNAQAHALQALFFLNVARFEARISSESEWIDLEEQDRSKWNNQLIAEGMVHLHNARNAPGRYYLEALIASIHCSAGVFGETNWEAIHFLYQQLSVFQPRSAAYRLGSIIARAQYAMSADLQVELNTLVPLCKGNALFSYYLTKAYLFQKSNAAEEAHHYYESAYCLAKSAIDKRFIRRKQAALNTENKFP